MKYYLILALTVLVTLSASSQNNTMKKRILMVVANPTIASTTNKPVGFWAAELTHPYYEFTTLGWDVVIASPNGGKVEMDSGSNPQNSFAVVAKNDVITLGYLQKPEFLRLLENTPKVADFKVTDFDAIFVCGGDAPPFVYPAAIELQKLFIQFYEAGKPSATLCHGTSLLLYTKKSDGKYLISGKKITGFSIAEELLVKQKTGFTISPIMIETETKKLGAEFKTAASFTPYALADANLITGQQSNSGRATANLVIEQLMKSK